MHIEGFSLLDDTVVQSIFTSVSDEGDNRLLKC